MDFRITRFVRVDGDGSLRAFCDVAVNRTLIIRGVRVVQGRTGPFVSMPRQQSKSGKWYDSVVPLSRETNLKLKRAVLDAFESNSSDEMKGDGEHDEP